MGAVATKQMPPLPLDTAGRWLDVVREDRDMVRRWLNVNHQMNRRYMREGPEVFGDSVAHRPWANGGAFYYWTPNFEVILRLVYSGQRNQHRVLSAGLVGRVSPQEALDLIVERSISYLRERNQYSAFAVAPKQADSPDVLRVFDLVPSHPRLLVTTEVESARVKRWNIDVPELQTS